MGILLCFATGLNAQNYNDALRHSRTQYLGTARFNAMGGSFGALGGDISAVSVNPAGIGVYRNSEFTFTTGFYLNQNEATYRNTLRDDNKLNFNLGNIGYVASYKGDPNGWKNYSFGISYNRIGSFHEEQEIAGTNTNDNSIVIDYVDILNNESPDVTDVENYAYPFGPSHAFYTFMIDTIGRNSYVRFGPITSAVRQSELTSKRGSMNDFNFSFGGNYQDRLYLGIAASLISSSYEEDRTFRESYEYSPPPQSNEFLPTEYEERTNLIINGTGFTARIGAIYKATQAIRLGAAIHIPTLWGFREEYSFNAESKFSDGTEFDQEQETFSNWEYRIQSPWRYNASAAYIHKNSGMINIDYEYVDYSTMRFDDRKDFKTSYSFENQEIREVLQGTHNIRIGAEYRVEPFVIRGGYRLEADPFNASEFNSNPDRSRVTYSLGSGFRTGNYNFDVTYMQSQSSYQDPVYNASDVNASINETEHHLLFTMGWRW